MEKFRSVLTVRDIRETYIIVLCGQWYADQEFTINKDIIPAEILSSLKKDSLLICQLNLEAETEEDLLPSDFEKPNPFALRRAKEFFEGETSMKYNQDEFISIDTMLSLENKIVELLKYPDKWKTLDVNYHPPRVERLWTEYNGYRIFLHTIHRTNAECLYHKHRWPAVFKQLEGSYEMGLTYSEKEISSEEAHGLSDLGKFILAKGSYYELTQTDALHYVKPISSISHSVMITYDLYPEADFRKEIVDQPLYPLSEERKTELIEKFIKLLNDEN